MFHSFAHLLFKKIAIGFQLIYNFDFREDGKALLKEITSRGHENGMGDLSHFATPAPLTAPLGSIGPIDRGLERVLRENNGSFASPQDSNSSSVRDLEPMNLSFTP